MSKKQTLSKAELQEMTGLDFSEQNSQVEESRKMEVDAAFGNLPIEDYKPESIPLVAEQVQTGVEPPVAVEQPSSPPIQRRVSSKQRKLSLEDYRSTFMRPYKIENRKPVFISGKLRKMLDKFACKIGEDRMSMSELLENIVRHHIELYSEDFEHWKGMWPRIGYAKDCKGIMYMNFGPLSREGGYRRLNVAITRAKHNVKLVGSIVPTDIDLDKVSSEGVKMLRSYIEFAQQGIVALEKELTFNYDLDFDSPFEEAVYDFLQSKGYNVVTQVGCSGFRIDMAVKHPTQSGKFASGIECDGAAYHSSRTARERDRLHQAVLEDIGWTIYRIWSTDWIKDQKTEEKKLINAVEKALGRAVIESEDNDVSDSSDGNADAVIPIIEIEEKIEPSEIGDKGYGFDLYKRAYPLNIIDENGNTREGYDIAWDIISLEQPIHFEELCRRIAPAYGRQKATSVVRDEVKYIFRNHLKGMIIEDKNEFIRIKDFADVKVRVPNPDDDYLRPIAYICDKELALAMKTIAQHNFGITPDDLFIVTAREFGFKRIGENIIYSLRKVYQQMLKNGEVTEVDGKVQVVS